MGRFDITKSSEPRHLAIEELESRTQFDVGDMDVAPVSVVTSEQVIVAGEPIVSGLDAVGPIAGMSDYLEWYQESRKPLPDVDQIAHRLNTGFKITHEESVFQIWTNQSDNSPVLLRTFEFAPLVSGIRIFGETAFLISPSKVPEQRPSIFMVSLTSPEIPQEIQLPDDGRFYVPIDETQVMGARGEFFGGRHGWYGGYYDEYYEGYGASFNFLDVRDPSMPVHVVTLEYGTTEDYPEGSYAFESERWNRRSLEGIPDIKVSGFNDIGQRHWREITITENNSLEITGGTFYSSFRGVITNPATRDPNPAITPIRVTPVVDGTRRYLRVNAVNQRQTLAEIDFDQPVSSVKVFGNRAYLLVDSKSAFGSQKSIYAISLDNPTAPVMLGKLEDSTLGITPNIPIDASHLLSVYRSSDYLVFSVYDVTIWHTPQLISKYVLSKDIGNTYLDNASAFEKQWNNIGSTRMEYFEVGYEVREYFSAERLSLRIDIESDYSLTTKATGFTLKDSLLIRDSADDRFSVRDREGSVQVLQRQPDGKFVPVGSFEFDEDIAEIRLLEDRLYLITKGEDLVADDGEIFEISLADPAVPVFLGKLNLPGSIFFAPLDATHVMTVYKSNQSYLSNRRISSAPVFLIYDIQDRTKPKLVAQKFLDVDSSFPFISVRSWSFSARNGEVSLTFGYSDSNWNVVNSGTIKVNNDYSLTISTPGFTITDVAISTLTPSSRLANESSKPENNIRWGGPPEERFAFSQPIRNLPVSSGNLNLPKTGAIIPLDNMHVMTVYESYLINSRFFATPVFSIYNIQDPAAPKLIRQEVLDLDSNLYETYSYLGDWVFSKEEGQVRLTVGFGPALTLYYKYFTIQVQDDYSLKADSPGFKFVDMFRVRDAENERFSVRQIGNNVQVLQRQADGRMLAVGTFELNEKISESRVFGDRLFLITRENDNALPETFAVSLTDPKAPLVVGKLTIPGKARSIPLDANHVMTVSPAYGPQEPIFYIYDVQDWANPKLVRTQVLHVDPSLGPVDYQLHLSAAQAFAGSFHSTGLTDYERFTIDGWLPGISAAVEIQDDYSLRVLSTAFSFIDPSLLASTPSASTPSASTPSASTPSASTRGKRIENLVGKSQAIGEVKASPVPAIVSNPGTTSEDGESAILPLAAYLINVPAEESVEATKKKEALSLPLVVNVLEPANEVSVAADDDDSGV